eukprot:8769627-Pyramimonas_sp.AAC.1
MSKQIVLNANDHDRPVTTDQVAALFAADRAPMCCWLLARRVKLRWRSSARPMSSRRKTWPIIDWKSRQPC